MDGPDRENIFSLAKHMDNAHFAPVAEVTAYWEALRSGRQLPLRSEVDPRGIERALEYAFVIERIAPQIARFRLAGTHLNDLMGMEVRGMPVSALFTPEGRADLGPAVAQVFAEPLAAELRLAAETGFGRPAMQARMVLLPLRSDLGDVSRALGCIVARGEVGRAPRRFSVSAMRTFRIEAGRPLLRDGATPAAEAQPAGLAEAAAPYAPPRQRPNLRLVKSD